MYLNKTISLSRRDILIIENNKENEGANLFALELCKPFFQYGD